MAQIECKISVTDIDTITSLLDVLADNVDLLPSVVVEAMQQAAILETVEYDVKYIESLGICCSDVVAYVDGNEIKNVISANRITKKVMVKDCPVITADSFCITYKGVIICGWGDNSFLKEDR